MRFQPENIGKCFFCEQFDICCEQFTFSSVQFQKLSPTLHLLKLRINRPSGVAVWKRDPTYKFQGKNQEGLMFQNYYKTTEKAFISTLSLIPMIIPISPTKTTVGHPRIKRDLKYQHSVAITKGKVLLRSKSMFLTNVTCRSEISWWCQRAESNPKVSSTVAKGFDRKPAWYSISKYRKKTYNEQKYQERELIPEKLVHHFRDEKETGAEIRRASVSGIITEDVPISYWPIFLPPPVTVREVSAKVNSPQFPFSFSSGKWLCSSCGPTGLLSKSWSEGNSFGIKGAVSRLPC